MSREIVERYWAAIYHHDADGKIDDGRVFIDITAYQNRPLPHGRPRSAEPARRLL